VFLAATRLREPKRGVHERLAAGADQETAEVEEKAAGFAETFRVLFNSDPNFHELEPDHAVPPANRPTPGLRLSPAVARAA
jgi:hypothetical protein